MLDKIANWLPTATLFAIRGAAFSELRNRGEIIQHEGSESAEPYPDDSFYYLGLRVKIVVERDFAHWYVYDGDSDPIEIGVEGDEDRAFDSATKWVEWYLSGEWKICDRSSYSTDPQSN
ncbi:MULTISPECIES: hypothetical protein [unclassified Microcoleus]|uniref:hypothetical protein n=1 Tax=unclassified Microcoleus TaxID=2642155 RepID=UPI001D7652C1|nr:MULTISPECIES: hypothetical protein [unclassified Microcoleus]MCC3595785.1 hypothetical protein [Microcoleus sp. PH2017_26_ELK_O_A]MCC3620586.1 hypothetical protein [Microcoleus sp. PH2017_36_ELK_O_B]